MAAYVDPAAGVVRAGEGAWPFELDPASGAAEVQLAGRSWRLRPLSWQEKRTLARFAAAGEPLLERMLLQACLAEGRGAEVPAADRAALLALGRWLNEPAEPLLPLESRLLTQVGIEVARQLGCSPREIESWPAHEVETTWQVVRRGQADPAELAAKTERAPAPDPDEGLTRIWIVPDEPAEAAAPAALGPEAEPVLQGQAPGPAEPRPPGRERPGARAGGGRSGSSAAAQRPSETPEAGRGSSLATRARGSVPTSGSRGVGSSGLPVAASSPREGAPSPAPAAGSPIGSAEFGPGGAASPGSASGIEPVLVGSAELERVEAWGEKPTPGDGDPAPLGDSGRALPGAPAEVGTPSSSAGSARGSAARPRFRLSALDPGRATTLPAAASAGENPRSPHGGAASPPVPGGAGVDGLSSLPASGADPDAALAALIASMPGFEGGASWPGPAWEPGRLSQGGRGEPLAAVVPPDSGEEDLLEALFDRLAERLEEAAIDQGIDLEG